MMGTARALWALFTLLCAGMTALWGSVGTLALLCVLLLLPLLKPADAYFPSSDPNPT